MKETLIKIIETDYNHQYLEIPTEHLGFRKRWDWIRTLVVGGDIVHRPRTIQHVDLRTPKYDDSRDMP